MLEFRFGLDMVNARELLEIYRRKNEIPLHYSLKMSQSGKLFKRIPFRLALPFVGFLVGKLNLRIGLYDLKSLPKGKFTNIESILKFEEKHPRIPSLSYQAPAKNLKESFRIV